MTDEAFARAFEQGSITPAQFDHAADVKAAGASGELSGVLRAHPALADKDLPLQYYSRERLFSDDARAAWVEPDIRVIRVFRGP